MQEFSVAKIDALFPGHTEKAKICVDLKHPVVVRYQLLEDTIYRDKFCWKRVYVVLH
jgi:hypothetical protein